MLYVSYVELFSKLACREFLFMLKLKQKDKHTVQVPMPEGS